MLQTNDNNSDSIRLSYSNMLENTVKNIEYTCSVKYSIHIIMIPRACG